MELRSDVWLTRGAAELSYTAPFAFALSVRFGTLCNSALGRDLASSRLASAKSSNSV